MYERLKEGRRVVGTRRLLRAVLAGEVQEAYLADDADLFIVRQVNEACNQAGVRIVKVGSKKELGELCGVQVATAAAGVLR